MPDVSSTAPEQVRLWVALDVHKYSIVAAALAAEGGGTAQLQRIETTERAIRRFVERLGGPEGLAVCYEAGPCGFDLLRVFTRLGVACDVIAPSLVPVRAGARVKTDRRDAKKLYEAGPCGFDLLRVFTRLRGCAPSAWPIPTPSARWSTCSPISTPSMPSWPRSTTSSSSSPPTTRGASPSPGCAASAAWACAPRWGCGRDRGLPPLHPPARAV